MCLVVLGIDALDADIINPDKHKNLALSHYQPIETIISSSGEPSTHELWPTIITGLPPHEHGLILEDGVSWENSIISLGSCLADYTMPNSLQTRLGAWILNNTGQDAFRTSAKYYDKKGLPTVFSGYESKTIGIPNYVTETEKEDREHRLRKRMGKLFKRDVEAKGGHTSEDPIKFYELCMEMSMIRISLVRRALRSKNYELVFGYTGGLDLIGHVSYNLPKLQMRAYKEIDDFVGELREDMSDEDELLIVSDHGLQNGVHTHQAMVAGTNPETVQSINSVLDVKNAIENRLIDDNHEPDDIDIIRESDNEMHQNVKNQLENLGYM